MPGGKIAFYTGILEHASGKFPKKFSSPLFARGKKGPLFPKEKVGSAMSARELHSKGKKGDISALAPNGYWRIDEVV